MDYYNYGAPAINPWFGTYPPPQMQNIYPNSQAGNNCQCENRFVWVQGREGAKAYPTAPNRTVLFLDDQEPYVYQKKTDGEGKTSEFKVYKLVEERDESKQEIPSEGNRQLAKDFITKDEFDQFSSGINNTLDQLMSKIDSLSQKPSYNKPYNNRKQVRNDV